MSIGTMILRGPSGERVISGLRVLMRKDLRRSGRAETGGGRETLHVQSNVLPSQWCGGVGGGGMHHKMHEPHATTCLSIVFFIAPPP
jgi:hypothetical protein